jgi:hypothetical protein
MKYFMILNIINFANMVRREKDGVSVTESGASLTLDKNNVSGL